MNSPQTILARASRSRRAAVARPDPVVLKRDGARREAADRKGFELVKVWLLACLGLVLIGIQLSLLHRIDSTAQLGLSFMVWPAFLYMVRRRWASVGMESSVTGVLCGGGLLALVLMNSVWMDRSNHVFPYLHPLFAGLGLGLLAVGFRGLRRYWRELTLLALLGIPRLLLMAWEGLALITAKVATFLIWYLGNEVELRGVEIVMPGGAVVVDQGCAGPGVISYLLCLAGVFIFLFPVSPVRQVLALMIAPAIAVSTNLLRVVLLALLEDAGLHDAFDYWHKGTGSPVWTMLPILIFFFVAMAMVDRPRKPGDTSQAGGEPEDDSAGGNGSLEGEDLLAPTSRP
jgi:cyanoexosortase A